MSGGSRSEPGCVKAEKLLGEQVVLPPLFFTCFLLLEVDSGDTHAKGWSFRFLRIEVFVEVLFRLNPVICSSIFWNLVVIEGVGNSSPVLLSRDCCSVMELQCPERGSSNPAVKDWTRPIVSSGNCVTNKWIVCNKILPSHTDIFISFCSIRNWNFRMIFTSLSTWKGSYSNHQWSQSVWKGQNPFSKGLGKTFYCLESKEK